MVSNMRHSAMLKAQAERLRRDFDDLISKLIVDEDTARYDYEREVPQLEQQIRGGEETIERIQQEIEVGQNRIIQLRDALRAATEDRREVEAIFGCLSKTKDHLRLKTHMCKQLDCCSAALGRAIRLGTFLKEVGT
ncbi:hypothetical protein N657DRAFT_161739 [Parathielavia appendiculata]|uniref:Uncharacterized protein n=1 Tax=Parathielavia appendiculata TaxID=2587402 RepID=A0AAN6Z156_9PEZI|nr:hypothetical protein N657DRAFT_161739 [Parathielavia appendiculata]